MGGGVVEDINCLGKWKDIKEYAINLIKNDTITEKFFFTIEQQLGLPFSTESIQSRFGMSFKKIVEYMDYNRNYKILKYLNEKWIVTDNQLDTFFQNILDTIKRFHIENPYKMGILKKQLHQRLNTTETFLDCCIDKLIEKNNLVRKKELITLKNFKIDLSNNELMIMDKIILILDEQGFSSQNHNELANSLKITPDKIKLLINIAEKNQKIIRLNEELLFTSKNFNKLIDKVKIFLSKNSKLTVSDFKGIARTTRKYAVPILEYLDKQNITYREGNYRKLA